MHQINPSPDVALEVSEKLFEMRYRRDFGLSSVEFENEPEEALSFQRMFYLLQDQRATLEEERRNFQQ